MLLIASTGTCYKCCGSGSGRIRIILPDPDRHPGHVDPDGYQFQANRKVAKLNYFPDNFNMLSKILKMWTHLILMRKVKLHTLTKVGKNYCFLKCVNLGVGFMLEDRNWFFMPIRIWILIWIGINMDIRIRIGIKTIAIHNTACTVIVIFFCKIDYLDSDLDMMLCWKILYPYRIRARDPCFLFPVTVSIIRKKLAKPTFADNECIP